MPAIADLHLPPGARQDPLSYPGDALAFSYLWMDSWVYRLRPAAGQPLGEWSFELDGGPLVAGVSATGAAPADLRSALASAGAAPVEVRYPVLAFGSNASPAQLLDKFGRLEPGQRVLPVTRGSVRGLRLSHSPHVSIPGYVPFVIVAGGAADLDVCVLWLDPQQLERLNETEPNYELVPVPGGRFALSLESGARAPAYSAYRGRWGALRRPGEQRPVVTGTQHEVFSGLLEIPWFRELVAADAVSGDVGPVVTRLRENPDLRESVRLELHRRELTLPVGWGPGGDGRTPTGC